MKMKFAIFALAAAASLCACTEDILKVPNGVLVEGADELGCVTLDFERTAGTQTLRLEVEGQWEALIPEDCTWLVAEPASGEAKTREKILVTLRAEENTAYEPRQTIVSFRCDKADQKDFVVVTQDKAFFRSVDFSHACAKVTGAAGTYTLPITVTNIDAWAPSTDAAWIRLERKGMNALTLVVEENGTGKARTAGISIAGEADGKEFKDELALTQLGAVARPDLLDVVFNEDGTAKDVSAAGREIFTSADAEKLTVAKDARSGRNVATFRHGYGAGAAAGAYTFKDYEMRAQFDDGYTLEAFVTCGVEPEAREAKFLSSTRSGGTALMTNTAMHLCFLYNGTPEGKKSWHFVDSGITPEPDKWYHVVGTWEQASGISRCYIDGKLEKEENFGPVKMYYNTLGTNSFMTIGANSSSGTAEQPVFNGGWNGSVAYARIYGDPLTPEQVEAAWINVQQGGILLFD